MRILSRCFFMLPFSQKLKIANDLELTDPDDVKLSDTERFRRVLLRARERGILSKIEARL